MSFWFVVRRSQISSALLFSYNTALGPPYRVIVDTNFSIQNELNLEKGMMDCLYAKCTPCITYCVMAQLEKLGQKYRVALRIAKDPRFHRLACTHKGTYAYDCIVERVTQVNFCLLESLFVWLEFEECLEYSVNFNRNLGGSLLLGDLQLFDISHFLYNLLLMYFADILWLVNMDIG
ncbi:uncharacterized protein LOC133926285 isoform X1 [Phragmites australis]|uniref:uncharacterized protein LOC133926285 isoform X1 n=1 Tax=Phragmites australis TaxID=29695 RepID=UPI002D768D2B|nr:uncharacterized protein LOC133926285 isoform X1 [Phragmites australis]XP_062228115.1 uncharacterized protein LOC133926285 isoform X1 [Phragmites australis]